MTAMEKGVSLSWRMVTFLDNPGASHETHSLNHSLALALCAVTSANAAEFCVANADELTNALYAAETNAENDTIRLVQGTYVGNFFYSNATANSLTLEGGYAKDCASRLNRPNKTVLDAAGAGTVLALKSTKGSVQFTVSNFTVRNGGAGGLDLQTDSESRRSKITLTSVRVLNNQGVGANIVSKNVNVNVKNAWFNTNTETGLSISAAANATVLSSQAQANSYGVGVYADTITLIKDKLQNNGSGAFLNGRSVMAAKNAFINNSNSCYYPNCALPAGGAAIMASYLLLDGNEFTNNSDHWGGVGAVNFLGGQAMVKGNLVRGSARGGLLLTSSSSVVLVNNLIYGSLYAMGVQVKASSITLTNNTITGNSGGGAVLLLTANTDTANVYNNLIWSNTADTGGDLYIDNDGDNDLVRSPVRLQNNDFTQAKPGGYYIKRSFPIPASNLDNVDPLFVDAANGDYHLQAGSPVIDLGDDLAPQLPAVDMDGDARVLGAHVDIGADEYKP